MMSVRQVAHLVIGLQVGGLERVVMHLIHAQANSERRPCLICLDEPGPWGEALAREGIPVYILHRGHGIRPRVIWKLNRLLCQLRPVVVHAHNPAPLVYGVLSSHLFHHFPVVYTRHGPGGRVSHPLIWRLTDRAVAVSQNARALFLQYNRISPEKVLTILNGIADPFAEDVRRPAYPPEPDLGLNPSLPVIGTVCRLEPAKDLLTLLDAFDRLCQRCAPAQLLIVGDGQQRGLLEERRTASPFAERIFLPGCRQDIPGVLRHMDVFAVSSVLEGLSVAILEAMAAGLPVVATDVGGNSEAIIDQATGLLVPSRAPDALAEALANLILNKQKCKEMGERARQRFLANFSADIMADRYEEVYLAAEGLTRQ